MCSLISGACFLCCCFAVCHNDLICQNKLLFLDRSLYRRLTLKLIQSESEALLQLDKHKLSQSEFLMKISSVCVSGTVLSLSCYERSGDIRLHLRKCSSVDSSQKVGSINNHMGFCWLRQALRNKSVSSFRNSLICLSKKMRICKNQNLPRVSGETFYEGLVRDNA